MGKVKPPTSTVSISLFFCAVFSSGCVAVCFLELWKTCEIVWAHPHFTDEAEA